MDTINRIYRGLYALREASAINPDPEVVVIYMGRDAYYTLLRDVNLAGYFDLVAYRLMGFKVVVEGLGDRIVLRAEYVVQ